MLNDIELVKSIVQMGAAGILTMAGYGMLKFLGEERIDRASERQAWFKRFDNVAERLERLTAEVTSLCAELRHNRNNGVK